MESSVGDGSGSDADTAAGGGSSGRRATTRTARRLRKIATIRKRPSRPASPAFQWLALIARPSAVRHRCCRPHRGSEGPRRYRCSRPAARGGCRVGARRVGWTAWLPDRIVVPRRPRCAGRTRAQWLFAYRSIPCSGNAPVNNISSNLTSYNGRVRDSRVPSSTRLHPFRFRNHRGLPLLLRAPGVRRNRRQLPRWAGLHAGLLRRSNAAARRRLTRRRFERQTSRCARLGRAHRGPAALVPWPE